MVCDDAELMLPHAVIDDFLDCETHIALLDYATGHAELFTPAKVWKGGGAVDETYRRVLRTRELGSIRARLEQPLQRVAPQLAATLGVTMPDVPLLELELTACGDKSHFRRHLDIQVGAGREPHSAFDGADRLISAVYYFHRQPRRFEGGDLRLFPLIGDGRWIDVEPRDNRLLAFPSWAPHQVQPVRCPEAEFEDYRFALNCWFCAPAGS